MICCTFVTVPSFCLDNVNRVAGTVFIGCKVSAAQTYSLHFSRINNSEDRKNQSVADYREQFNWRPICCTFLPVIKLYLYGLNMVTGTVFIPYKVSAAQAYLLHCLLQDKIILKIERTKVLLIIESNLTGGQSVALFFPL